MGVKKTMTSYAFLKRYCPHAVSKVNDVCPSKYGLPNNMDWCRRCEDVGCWFTQITDEEQIAAMQFLDEHGIPHLPFTRELCEKENEPTQPNETCPAPDGPVEIINVLKSADPAVENPSHYEFSKFSPIKVIRAWGLNFNLGSAVKYIVRAGKKDPTKHIQDLEKAVKYLQSEIEDLRAEQEADN